MPAWGDRSPGKGIRATSWNKSVFLKAPDTGDGVKEELRVDSRANSRQMLAALGEEEGGAQHDAHQCEHVEHAEEQANQDDSPE